MARIWIVNPFDPVPGDPVRPGRYAWICEQLAAAGHEVTWWSSDFFHVLKQRRGRGWEERRPAATVRIVFVPTLAYARNISVRRLYSHFLYARQLPRAFAAATPPDLIITSFPPIGSSRKVVEFAHARGVPVVVDVQDLWPDAFDLAFPKPLRRLFPLALPALKASVRRACEGADAVMGVSQAYVDHGMRHARKPLPSLVLPLGVDLKAFDGQAGGATNGSQRERWAAYAGTVGRAYDLRALAEAAALERKAGSRTMFRVMGDGPDLPRLRRWTVRMGLDNMTFHGRLALPEMASMLRRSMVGLHCVAAGWPPSLTNKLFDYLAAGLPIVNSVPGEADELLRTEGVGVTYPAGDAHGLHEALQSVLNDPARWSAMSARARQLAIERFDRHRLYARLEPFLDALLRSVAPRARAMAKPGATR